MTRYLLDANCLIQAKNLWYGFDFCPGFWDWIDISHSRGQIFSVDKVKDELTEVNDELSIWAKNKASFFLPTDAATLACYRMIVAWAQGSDFKETGKSEFLNCADPFIVAYAASHPDFVLVSHEVYNPVERRRIKIQAPCNQFGVTCVDIWTVLRELGIKLVHEEDLLI